jgi:hypothetical protein
LFQGRFALKVDRTRAEIVYDYEELLNRLHDKKKKITGFELLSEGKALMVLYKELGKERTPVANMCLMYGCMVTSRARQILGDMMNNIPSEHRIYSDTGMCKVKFWQKSRCR